MDFFIVYSKGDKTKLDIVQAFDYEKDDFELASKQSYSKDRNAIVGAIMLANKHGLEYIGYHLDENDDKIVHNYLD